MRLIAAMTLWLLVTAGCATRAELVRAEALIVRWQERATEREGQLKQLQSKLNGAEERLARAQADCQVGSLPGSPKPPASMSTGIDDQTIDSHRYAYLFSTQDDVTSQTTVHKIELVTRVRSLLRVRLLKQQLEKTLDRIKGLTDPD